MATDKAIIDRNVASLLLDIVEQKEIKEIESVSEEELEEEWVKSGIDIEALHTQLLETLTNLLKKY